MRQYTVFTNRHWRMSRQSVSHTDTSTNPVKHPNWYSDYRKTGERPACKPATLVGVVYLESASLTALVCAGILTDLSLVFRPSQVRLIYILESTIKDLNVQKHNLNHNTRKTAGCVQPLQNLCSTGL